FVVTDIYRVLFKLLFKLSFRVYITKYQEYKFIFKTKGWLIFFTMAINLLKQNLQKI
ncbi:hypothetical protein GLOIN_2v1632728, partial [Rhizophagus irregularis DAOM 181602=DAOM 197198]